MNITGGNNLSLFEVQEAAEIVASASNEELNMIFGSVINENLTDEIIVTVIATGFTEKEEIVVPKPSQPTKEETPRPYQREQRIPYQEPEPIIHFEEVLEYEQHPEELEESQDIPAFLRNRKKRFRSF
jgi:cell division protein FtsZ